MKKIIFAITALLIVVAIGAAMFYYTVTDYAIDYNQRLSDIQNKYDTTLEDYKNNKNLAISYVEEYATKGKPFVKCSINDVKSTVEDDGLQTFKIHYRTIENYNIGKYIAFITVENGKVASLKNFKDLE